ncbi:MAG: hypothetical protein ACKV19_09885 [Verrucomicrobiales bacterium]
MGGIGVFVFDLALGALAPGSGRAKDSAKDLAAILVSGQWVKDHGKPPLQDQHVYTFAKDGRFSYKLVTDHNTPLVTGRWELAAGKEGKVILRLKDQKGRKDYYWLAEGSAVRYDLKKDVLLVSGARYDGEQPLRHIKDEKKAK